MKREMPPCIPGKSCWGIFAADGNHSVSARKVSLGVSQRRVGEILTGKRAITADTALRLARFFGTDAQSWMNLQAHYELEKARDSAEELIIRKVQPYAA
jgi:addiction module HigA family antidote